MALRKYPSASCATVVETGGLRLEAWAEEQEQEHKGDRLALTPADLGLRITYLASALGTEEPYRDMALPFAVER